MMQQEIKRCAVYTRKSTEDGLELAYNSLDAQYDSCSAYIKSQVGLGWTLVEKRYDDGGYSGGNVNRPGLNELINDVKQGLIDIIVVYKLDRLSRKLSDFSDLFKVFEKNHVEFVSVTQKIDTSTAAGRMMLNILMSFAQFEREMSVDRVRDKVYSSKKRGLWVGGPTPYGYKVVDKKLVVDPETADCVRFIFKRYSELGSAHAVAKELTEQYPRRDGGEWNSRRVYTILKSVVYMGKVAYAGTKEMFDGVHEALITEEQYKLVQDVLDANAVALRGADRHAILAPLKGLIRCGACGSAMSPAYTNFKGKKNRRYIYYRCAKNAKKSGEKCGVSFVSGEVIERFVFAQLEAFLRREDVLNLVADGDATRRLALLGELDDMNAFWDKMTFEERERYLHMLVKEVVLNTDKVDIVLTIDGTVKSVPYATRRDMGKVRMIADAQKDDSDDGSEFAVTKMFRKTRQNLELLTSGTYETKKDLANALGVSGTYISRTLRMQFLSPTIVERIFKGELPDLSVERMSRCTTLIWAEQEAALLDGKDLT